MATAREAEHDASLVQFLRLHPRLDGLLEALGVPAADREAVQHKLDTRRCTVCGSGYVRCRTVDAKAPLDERHEWTPNHSRSGS